MDWAGVLVLKLVVVVVVVVVLVLVLVLILLAYMVVIFEAFKNEILVSVLCV